MRICQFVNVPINRSFLFIGTFTNCHIIYLDRTSFLIKETYDKAKHTTVAAINPVSCGQTTKRLWPKGNGLGIAPCTCSIVSGPKLLTEGISNVIVASLNNSLGAKRSKFNINPW